MQETNFSVTHNSSECDVISLDAGLRLDGLRALDLWDLGIEAPRSCSIQLRARRNQLRDKHCEKHSNERTKKQSNTTEYLRWTNVQYVTSNAKPFFFATTEMKGQSVQCSDNQGGVPLQPGITVEQIGDEWPFPIRSTPGGVSRWLHKRRGEGDCGTHSHHPGPTSFPHERHWELHVQWSLACSGMW